MIEMVEKTGTNPNKDSIREEFEKIKKACGEMPPELTFRGCRKIVMTRVWEHAQEAERLGQPLTPESFSTLLTAEWQKIKKEIPRLKVQWEKCRGMTMKGAATKGLSKDELETRVEYFFEVKKQELLNDLGVQE